MYIITFNISRSSQFFGKIIVKDVTAAPVGGEVSAIEITTPSGSVLTMPDLVLDASNITTIPIPTTNGGVFLGGDYSFKITRESTDGSSGVFVYEAAFCSLYKKAGVSLDVDCIRALGNVVDLTEYPSGAVVTREMKVVFPPIPEEADVEPFVTTNTEATFAVTWANVSYLVYLTANVSWETSLGSGVFVVEEFSVNETINVACPSSICSIASCVNKELNRILAKASKYQGFKKMPSDEFDRIIAMIGYLSQYSAFVECGNYRLANEVFNKMGELIQCDCGCDGDTDGPVRIANEGGTVPVITIQGEASYINVSENAGVYTITIDPTFLSRLLALRNSIVTSVDNTVSVETSYNAGSNTATYDLSLNRNDIIELTNSEMNAPFDCWTSNMLRYLPPEAGQTYVRFIGRVDGAIVDGTAYAINDVSNAISANPVNYDTSPVAAWGSPYGTSDPKQIVGYAYVTLEGELVFVANAAGAAMTTPVIQIYVRYDVNENTPDTVVGGGSVC
jgi:hypothetical protein